MIFNDYQKARWLLRSGIRYGLFGLLIALAVVSGWFECRRVVLVGRRGPVQAACTAKELREIMGKLY